MEFKLGQKNIPVPIRMFVTKQKELRLPLSHGLTTVQRQGVIFSEVSTPSGVKLVQLLLNLDKTSPLPKEEEHCKPAPLEDCKAANDVCTICGQLFSEKIAFNAHIKVHLKEKLRQRAKLGRSTEQGEDPPNQIQGLVAPSASVKRKYDSIDDPSMSGRVKLENVVKAEPALSYQPTLSQTEESPCDIEDNFVSSEFSKEMEINRLDLNNDITSILDQIEKDFEGPNIDISKVPLETPPDSDSETPEFFSSLLTEESGSSPPRDLFQDRSLTLTPESLVLTELAEESPSTGSSSDEISFEKLLDVSDLCGEEGGEVAEEPDTSARDHDYLMTRSYSPRLVEGNIVAAAQMQISRAPAGQINVMKYANIPASALALINQVPGRILIQRSALDSRVLNVFGMGRISQAAVHQDSEELAEEEQDRSQRSSRQSAECNICGKTITTKNMARHMEKHTGKKKFKCDVCQAAFFQKTHLKNHILLHDSSEFFECNDCGQKFLRRTDFHKHLKTIHSVEMPISCNVCGAQFTEMEKFDLHRQAHSAVRQELCGLCGDKFHSKAAMISHMQKHTGVQVQKPFSCSVCHKTFSQKSHLNRHIKSHGGEEELVCGVCRKQCKNKVELVRHRSSHVACYVCKRLLDSRVELQQHLLRAHPAQPSLNLLSPESLDLDLFEADQDQYRPLSRCSVDIMSSNLDSSPAPSSVESSMDLLESSFPHFLSDFGSEGSLMGDTIRSKHNLSLDDISDSSFFDINHHLDDDILSTDIFASVK